MVKSSLTGTFTIKEIETKLQKTMQNTYSMLIEKMEKNKKN